MYLFQMLMEDIFSDEAALKDKNLKVWITSVFMFSVVWSIGATGDKPSLEKFDTFVRDLLGGKMEDHPMPPDVGKIDCPFPPEGMVYDYLFEVSILMYKYCICIVIVCACDCRQRGVANGHTGLI